MAKLEYDESGSTFTYFLVLVYGLFLLILTYFVWPRELKGQDKNKHVCQCGPCCRKRTKLETRRPLERIFKYLRILLLVLFWALLFLLIYWALTQEREYVEWDPYDILQIDRGATTAQIRKQYRELSKLHHPDKGGDPEVFTKIAKAYEALTNEEAKENWEKYGNPDGPQAASFGIALPSWIVDKKNSLWVLGTYILIFMIGLPAIVGTWWYRSVKYGTTNILIQTSQLYTHLLSRAKTIPTKRLITILATAIELSHNQQAGVKDRPSDDIYLNQLVKQLEHSVRVDTREQPFCRTYVAKARLLLHSYLEHNELQDPGLLQDQDAIVKYTPHLLNEMLNILTQLWSYSKMQSKQSKGMRKIPEPSADMYENIMRISQILVQAIWFPFQPLLQLPHVENDHLRYFTSKKHRIGTIEEFCALKGEERRRILKSLSDEEYHDVITFCSNFPYLTMTVETEVPDDEDTSLISAGSLVTVKIFLRRTSLLSQYGESIEQQELNHIVKEQGRDDDELILSHVNTENKIPETLTFDEDATSSQTKKETKASLVKQQQRKKKKGKGGGANTKGQKKKPVHRKAPPTEETQREKELKRQEIEEDDIKRDNENDESDDELGTDNDLPDDEREWKELQKSIQKERDQKKNQITSSHIVHAPYFPAEKQELWWAYIIDRKTNTVIVPPEKIVGLQETKEVNLRLIAEKKGTFKYMVVVNSDSYLYCMIQQELKIKVHEKKEVSGKEQWEELEKEEEEEDVIEESVTESEGEEESD